MKMLGKSALTALVIALLSCAYIAFIAVPAEAAGGAKLTAGVTKKVLGNGITILVKESKANDVVAVQLVLGMGSKFESDKEAGISRLLQQCMLKGTKTRTAEQIADAIESVGGRINAGSTKEVGFIQLTCTSEGLGKAMDVFFDVISNPTLPVDEVNKEKALQIRRIRERKDQLFASTVDLAQETLYESHPFHKPGEGYEETVGTLGRDQVLEAYKRFYRPENIIIAAVGNLDSKKFVKEVEKKLKGLKATGKRLTVELPAVTLAEPRTKLNHKESSSAWIVMAYPTPGPSQKDYLPAQVLDCVLGGSMNSRLFTELRDKKGLGYQVGSFYAGYSRDAFVGAYIGTRPDKFEVARDAILEEVGKLRSAGITDEELINTKKYLRGAYIIDLESNASQVTSFATNECFGIGYDFADRYLEGIVNVTKDDVLKVANAYFATYALGSILPESATEKTQKSEGKEQEQGRE
jgi:zinc protease